MLLRFMILMISLQGMAGCMWGPRLENFGPAQSPNGIFTAIVVIDQEREAANLSGELLAVRDEGLVVRTNERIVLVSYERIREGRFRDKASLRIGAGRAPGPAKREQLRLMSRFPQGLEGAVLDRLLQANSQEEMEVIR